MSSSPSSTLAPAFDEDFFRIMGELMRSVQGKSGPMPIEYSELCRCHPPTFGSPTPGILGKDLKTTAAVLTGLETILGTPINEEYNIRYRFKVGYGFQIYYMREKDWSSKRKYHLYATTGELRPGSGIQLGRGNAVNEDPLSSACLARVKTLLLKCQESHPHCWTERITTLPTRVLYIGDHDKYPKLLCTQGKEGEYVALSHCWGSTQTLTTTSATLQERQEGIAWDALPRTFQDAIKVTRELGFDFIWIDSLCIIQDDHEDWEAEAARMGSVYMNAVLTIAASVAVSDEAGLRQHRTDHLSTNYSFEHATLGSDPVELSIRAHLPSHKRHDIASKIRDSFRSNVIGPAAPLEPLDFRAWTFQEKLVSRRLLSFCEREFEWDCLSSSDCECGKRQRDFNVQGWDARNGGLRQVYQSLMQEHLSGADAVLRGRGSHQLTRDFAMRFKALQRGEHVPCGHCPDCIQRTRLTVEGRRLRAYSLWRTHLVPAYSQLRLTKESDRLPALQAVARSLQPLCGDYVAGMWKDDLVVGMAWKAGEFGADGPKPGRPVWGRAPFWSWASIEGAVDHCADFEDDLQPIASLLWSESLPKTATGSQMLTLLLLACVAIYCPQLFRCARAKSERMKAPIKALSNTHVR